MIVVVVALCAVAVFLFWLYMEPRGPIQPVKGLIFVTGCDSGMGHITALRFASLGYTVAGGCFQTSSESTLEAAGVIPVPLDVTSDASVRAAVAAVTALEVPLIAIVNCAGVAFEGPCEYLPLHLFQAQLDVNLLGYVRVTQAFFPLLKAGVAKAGRRGRVVLVGTGGGVPAAMPATLGAYMASKWAVEAWCQALRQEMQLRELPIDAVMINPGTVKPTGLQDNGKSNLDKAWSMMPPEAKAEYGSMLDAFVTWGEAEPGTHPRFVADAMETAMSVYRPRLRYKVGPDSKASVFAGLAPTWLRELAIRKTVFGAYKQPSEH